MDFTEKYLNWLRTRDIPSFKIAIVENKIFELENRTKYVGRFYHEDYMQSLETPSNQDDIDLARSIIARNVDQYTYFHVIGGTPYRFIDKPRFCTVHYVWYKLDNNTRPIVLQEWEPGSKCVRIIGNLTNALDSYPHKDNQMFKMSSNLWRYDIDMNTFS